MCVFCQIISKTIPSDIIYENEELIAFNDLHPQAKTHILIVPRKHIGTIKDIREDEGDAELVGRMVLTAKKLADDKGLEGYRLQFNVGRSGGQLVFHIHLHLISNG